MIKAKIRISGYRCFSNTFPVEINISNGFTSFIGPNNSGKSSLLRFFYDFKPAFSFIESELTNRKIHEALSEQNIYLTLNPLITDPVELLSHKEQPLSFEIEFPSHDDQVYIQKLIWTFIPKKQEVHFKTKLSDGSSGREAMQRHILNQIKLSTSSSSNYEANTKDITTLIHALSSTLYIGPFRNAINEGGGNYYELAIGIAFIDQWNAWKNGPSIEGTECILKVTEDIRRLLGVKQLEINSSPILKTLNVIIDNKSRKLSELGSGLSQLIMVLGNAIIKKPSFILIDEPETHLHPSLQVDFLTSLTSYAEYGVMYATHSLGLARVVSDQCYSVIPTTNGSKISLYDKTPHLAEFLGSMGIAGLQEIGFSHILCVEGPTDVRTYQQILRKFDLERKVVIIPLGGDSLINERSTNEFSELLRLGSNISVIIDSEKRSETESVAKGRLRFKQNCENLRISCHILKRRATENYFTDRAIKALYGDNYKALGDYDSPSKDENKFWGKSENWRIAQLMTKEEFEDTDLGQFIKTIN